MKAQEQCLPWAQMADKIALLDVVLGLNDVAMLRKMLTDLVSGYRPGENIVDWLHQEYLAELAEGQPAQPPEGTPQAIQDVIQRF
jgi:hypothetical protein